MITNYSKSQTLYWLSIRGLLCITANVLQHYSLLRKCSDLWAFVHLNSAVARRSRRWKGTIASRSFSAEWHEGKEMRLIVGLVRGSNQYWSSPPGMVKRTGNEVDTKKGGWILMDPLNVAPECESSFTPFHGNCCSALKPLLTISEARSQPGIALSLQMSGALLCPA